MIEGVVEAEEEEVVLEAALALGVVVAVVSVRALVEVAVGLPKVVVGWPKFPPPP